MGACVRRARGEPIETLSRATGPIAYSADRSLLGSSALDRGSDSIASTIDAEDDCHAYDHDGWLVSWQTAKRRRE
jgi:hypothetical protein